MGEVYAGKCIYCGNKIFYQGGETLVKCGKCRETLVIAEFINEKQRMDAVLAEGEKARRALQEAEAERDRAREQLLQTVTTIEQLQNGQEESREKLKQVLQKQDANQETQKAALTLLSNLYAGQERNQDILTSLLSLVMSGQKTAEEKLYTLQSVAKKISNAQDDIGTLLQDIKEYLSTDTRIRNQQIGDLVIWAQSVHKEDVQRLEAISMSAGELATGQKELNQQIAKLQGAVTKTEQAVHGFEKKWQQKEIGELTESYRQAENRQLDRDFDQAEKLYQQVLIQGGKDPEVYWRMLLCHYCVVYQNDNEGNRILTILYPDQTDPAEMTLWKELKNCEQTPEQRDHYQQEIAKLEQVIRKYREVRFDREYDVFISVKQTDWQNGKKFYTKDYQLGQLLYNHITTKLGLKVFNSETKECKCPAGQEWEPYILAALLSSKVMIVVGSCSEYMESQWVKNEWQRYQWLQKKENEKGKSERKLLCYISDSMNAYDIPQGLNPDHQAIINNANAFEELDTALKEVFPKLSQSGEEGETKPAQEEETKPLSTVLAKMQAWLYLERFDRVLEEYNQLVTEGKYLDSCTMHLYALCGSYKAREICRLVDYVPQILQEKDGRFDLAQKCAKTEQEHQEIDKLIELTKQQKKNLEQAQKEIKPPLIGAWKIANGSIVWFGQRNGKPISWRVLANGSDDRMPVSGKGAALLISNSILAGIPFNPDYRIRNANVWFRSNAQHWCTYFLSNWADGSAEKAAIKPTSVKESNDEIINSTAYYYHGGCRDYYYGAASLNKESFFFLSAQEADAYFENDVDRKAAGINGYWWLRSPHADNSEYAGFIDFFGWVTYNVVDILNGGARPAFNLNLTSVLFSSLVSTSESAKEYKLTFMEKSENLKISIPDGARITKNGKIVKIPYGISGTRVANTTKVYVLVLDKKYTDYEATVKQYVQLTTDSDGIGSFVLSGINGTWGKDYYVYIVAVNESGSDQLSDAASVPLEIHAP